jgi:hypothetical protein
MESRRIMGAARRLSNRSSIMAKKKKNTGVPYEKLVQGIFQAINDQEKVATIAWIIHEVSSQKEKDALKGMMNTGFLDPAFPFGASIT